MGLVIDKVWSFDDGVITVRSERLYIATTTVAGMSAGTYIVIEVAIEGAEIGLITAGIIGAAIGAVASFLRKFNNLF